MGNFFSKKMSEKTDGELNYIIENNENYQEDAIIAAVDELENRNLATNEVLAVKEDFVKVAEEKRKEENNDKDEKKKVFKDIGLLLKPRKNYYITPILVYINVLIYLLMIVSGIDPLNPTPETLFIWGGTSGTPH